MNDTLKINKQSNNNIESVELSKPTINQQLLKFNTLEELKDYAKIMCASGRCGAKTPEEAIALYTQANELGIGFASASNHMHVVNGKSGLDIHIITALLLRAGIEWTVINYYIPLYKYIDGSGIVFTSDTLPSNYAICSTKEQVAIAIDNGKHPVNIAKDTKGIPILYDYCTHIRFKRERQREFSKGIYIQEADGIFYWSDAITAGLIRDGSGWIKYPKVMMFTRPFILGARRIGDDLLMGMSETSELYDIEKKNYTVTENGTAIIVE